MARRERFVVVVHTKDGGHLIGIVGVFFSKKSAESWIASTPDLGVDNVREIHQLLDTR